MAKTEQKFEYRIKLGPKHKLSISIFKNQQDDVVLNLRKFYLGDDEETWLPDRQGLTMHLEQAVKLRKITKLLEEIADDAPEPNFGKKKKSKDKDEEPKSKKSKKKKSKKDDDDDEEDDDE